MAGRKDDNGKERWSLLPWQQVKDIVKVLTFGARKYSDGNWMRVSNARDRYFSAAMRHIEAWSNHEKLDPESGFTHLAHAACCILFLMWIDDNETELARPDLSATESMEPPEPESYAVYDRGEFRNYKP